MKTQKEDSISITQQLENKYFKGIYLGEVPLLSETFHPGALLFGDVNGEPYAKTLAQYLNIVANRQSPKELGTPFKGEILQISVIQSIAIAEVKVKMYDFNYHEFLSFHKIDGKWLIVNKMMSNVNQ